MRRGKSVDYIRNPQLIETESFKIIQEIIDQEFPEYVFSSPKEEKINKRVIHTSADFDYLKNLVFSNDVISELEKFFWQETEQFLQIQPWHSVGSINVS